MVTVPSTYLVSFVVQVPLSNLIPSDSGSSALRVAILFILLDGSVSRQLIRENSSFLPCLKSKN